MVESGCGAGCFPSRASRVASFIGASVSSELASLTAHLRSPSSNFADMRAANRVSRSSVRRCFLTGLGLAVGGRSTSSFSCLLTAEASDCQHPPRAGHLRQCALKRNRRIHKVLFFLSIKAPRIAASFLPAHFLEALGRRLMVFSDVLRESAESGDRVGRSCWPGVISGCLHCGRRTAVARKAGRWR